MKHIMIDLETIGTRPGASILTIGAIKFDPNNIDLEHATPETLSSDRVFYRRICRQSCHDFGLHEDRNTLEWWNKQTSAARKEAFEAAPREDLIKTFHDFAGWCGNRPLVWSHGASFDIVLCEHVFNGMGVVPPWKFWDIRDTRTLFDFTTTKPKRDTNHHHALWDAISQAFAVQEAYASNQPAYQVAQ